MRAYFRRFLGIDDNRLAAAERAIESVQKALAQIPTAPPPPFDDSALRSALETLDERMGILREAVAEGIERVDRSERRISQVVRRARARYEGDPGVEAEYQSLEDSGQLRLGHGEGSGASPVSSVPEALEGRRLDFTAIPGAISDEDIAALINRYGN